MQCLLGIKPDKNFYGDKNQLYYKNKYNSKDKT